MAFRSASGVCRYEAKAAEAVSGIDSTSASERPLRVRSGLLVMGEMVVIFSSDMMTVRASYVTFWNRLNVRCPANRDGKVDLAALAGPLILS